MRFPVRLILMTCKDKILLDDDQLCCLESFFFLFLNEI